MTSRTAYFVYALVVMTSSVSLAQPSSSSWGQENIINHETDSHPGHDVNLKSVMIANNIFCRNLFQKLPQSGNIVFSPLTITTALEMVYLGARKGTAREMGRALQHTLAGFTTTRIVHKNFEKLQDYLERDSKYTLNYVNGILLDESFNVSSLYKRNLKKYYHAEVKKVNFADGSSAMTEINEWVSEATRNKIPQLLSEPLDPTTACFVLSAVYFKGTWMKTFEEELTAERTFYNNGVDPVQVPMMRMLNEPLMFGRDPEKGISAVELPYRGGDYSMLIILPDERDGLPALEGRASGIKDAIGLDRPITEFMNVTEVDLTLPKFRIEVDFDLVDSLKSMGMKKVFQAESANLQGMDKRNDSGLHIGTVLHKAVIEVSEEGTEAAAVSGIAIYARSGPMPGVKFIADHPFLFFIRDVHSGIVIFAGRVTQL